jgi:hypothetical protein
MPAVDELDVVRQLLDVPGPRAEVTVSGRARLAALVAREAGESAPAARERTGCSRRHASWARLNPRVALAGGAVAAAVAAAAVLVALRPGAGAAQVPAVSPAAGADNARPHSAAAVQRAILAAVTSAGGDVLYIRRVSEGPASAMPQPMQVWFWPSQPGPGRPARMLTVIGDAEVQMTFTVGQGDAYVSGGSGTPVTGTETIIDNQARTWSIERQAPLRPQLPAVTSLTVLRQDIAADYWRITGRPTIGGQAAIELTSIRPAPNGLSERLWVSAQTYQPLRFLKQDWNGPGTALIYRFSYLPPTPANLVKLSLTVPPGYKRAPAP